MGATMLDSLRGIGPAFSPLVRGSYSVLSWLSLRVGASGFGSRPLVQGAAGEARVSEGIALFEALVTPRAGSVRPLLSAGIGANRWGVTGSGVAPYQGVSRHLLAAAFDVGAGGEVAIVQPVSLSLELHAMMSWPYPSVQIGNVEVGRAGYPAMITSLCVVVGR